MKSMVRAMAALLLVGAACGATQAQAGLILDLTTPGHPASCGSCGSNGTTFGWSFTVNAPVTVDGIGVWASNAGVPFSTEAGLFTASGTLLESAMITPASTPVASADPAGGWLFEKFAPITLPVGDYLLGSVFGDSEPLAELGSGITTIPEITFNGGVVGPGNAGLAAPTSGFSTPIFGPTLETVAGVPEPATWAMLILGLAMIGFAARRRNEGIAIAA